MNKAFLIILPFFLFFFHDIYCQEVPLNSQKFFNPYTLNPAFAGYENRPAVFAGRRQQWTGIDGAPVTNYFNFHTVFGNAVPFGLNIVHDTRGIVSTNTALLTLGFRARIDENNHYLSLAFSGGAGFNSVDFSNVNVGTDPILISALDNNIFLDGNAGLLYHNNGFNLGVSLPKLFKTRSYGFEDFEIGDFNPMGTAMATINYKIEVSEETFAIDPWFSYHYFENFDDQIEGSLRFILKNFVWVGGSYRLDYGASAFFGLNIKDNFRFGYAYELGVASVSGFNNGSHEFHLGLIFGKTEKEKNKKDFYTRRRQMLNTMRGNTQQQTQNQNLYKVQNDPFETTTTETTTTETTKTETTTQTDTNEIDIDKFMEGYTDEDTTQQQQVTNPTQIQTQTRTQKQPEPKEEPSILSTFDAPQNDEVTTRDESGIYIGPKVVTKGDHLLELDKGYYVIVGTFNSYREAEEYSDKLFMQGFYTKFGYISQTTDYYVYLFYSEDNRQECDDTMERFRQITSIFTDMWVLTVQ